MATVGVHNHHVLRSHKLSRYQMIGLHEYGEASHVRQVYCGAGEVYDLLEADLELQRTSNGIDLTRTPAQIFHDVALSGRCSALITVTGQLHAQPLG